MAGLLKNRVHGVGPGRPSLSSEAIRSYDKVIAHTMSLDVNRLRLYRFVNYLWGT